MTKELDKTLLELAKSEGKWLKNNSSSVCNWVLIGKEGGVSRNKGMGCYSGFRNNPSHTQLLESDGEIALMVDWHRSRYTSKERIAIETRYIDWLINRSPYADMFIRKDAESYITTPAVYDVKRPPQELICGAEFLRNRQEQPNDLYVWAKLVDKGMGENFAAFFSSVCRMYSKANNGKSEVLVMGTPKGHCPIDTTISASAIMNFVSNSKDKEFLKKAVTVAKGNFQYSGLMKLWGLNFDGDYYGNGNKYVSWPEQQKNLPISGGWTDSVIQAGTHLDDIMDYAEKFCKLNKIGVKYIEQ